MIPQGWEEKTLGEILDKVKYTSKIQSKLYKDKGKYPIISQEDVFISGYWDNPSDVYYVKHPIVIFGDHTKVVKYIDFDFVLGADGVKILDPTKDINAKFLYYWTKYVPLRNLGYARHYKLLSEKTIHFPPLPEQERIVAKLDEAFEAIDKVKANAEQNLTNAKELFERALNRSFTENTEGWEEKTLDSISDLKQNKAEVKNIDANTLVSFVPMEYLGINQKYFNSNQSKPIKNLIKSYTYFAENDVIMAKITPCFENGKIGIARGLMNKIGFGSSEYIVFRTNKDINSEYLYYFLNRETFRKEGAQNMLGAVGHKRVSKEFIENYPFSYPSLLEQQKIVEKLDALQEQTKQLEQIYTKKIKECDELKQSILQKAFRGEL